MGIWILITYQAFNQLRGLSPIAGQLALIAFRPEPPVLRRCGRLATHTRQGIAQPRGGLLALPLFPRQLFVVDHMAGIGLCRRGGRAQDLQDVRPVLPLGLVVPPCRRR